MSSLAEVWTRLGAITVLQFRSQSRSGIGWSGLGSGLVKAVGMAPDAITFEETGQWQQLGGKTMRFSNCFRWSRVGEQLHLEHLRFGAANPVFLFAMAPDEAGIWHDIDPHPCRDDCYSATLQLDPSRLLVNWSVSGPKRDESINYIYF